MLCRNTQTKSKAIAIVSREPFEASVDYVNTLLRSTPMEQTFHNDIYKKVCHFTTHVLQEFAA
jgi:hypothetical protein